MKILTEDGFFYFVHVTSCISKQNIETTFHSLLRWMKYRDVLEHEISDFDYFTAEDFII